jgi:hypothetical protein
MFFVYSSLFHITQSYVHEDSSPVTALVPSLLLENCWEVSGMLQTAQVGQKSVYLEGQSKNSLTSSLRSRIFFQQYTQHLFNQIWKTHIHGNACHNGKYLYSQILSTGDRTWPRGGTRPSEEAKGSRRVSRLNRFITDWSGQAPGQELPFTVWYPPPKRY